jgi:hypothetical protein
VEANVGNREVTTTYVGQVERDPDGALWAVLYHGDEIIVKEQVRTLRKGKRRVTDLVLSAVDTFPTGPRRPARTHLNRLVEHRAPAPRQRRTNVAANVA